ncbi:hypothetical protein [Streptomyces sp. NPDC060194]|uniref:hypothetical protein n=1 Tax=Streptomyces sp. NPDC060194 TaxID=3347069 RepID=UPI0036484AE5
MRIRAAVLALTAALLALGATAGPTAGADTVRTVAEPGWQRLAPAASVNEPGWQ